MVVIVSGKIATTTTMTMMMSTTRRRAMLFLCLAALASLSVFPAHVHASAAERRTNNDENSSSNNDGATASIRSAGLKRHRRQLANTETAAAAMRKAGSSNTNNLGQSRLEELWDNEAMGAHDEAERLLTFFTNGNTDVTRNAINTRHSRFYAHARAQAQNYFQAQQEMSMPPTSRPSRQPAPPSPTETPVDPGPTQTPVDPGPTQTPVTTPSSPPTPTANVPTVDTMEPTSSPTDAPFDGTPTTTQPTPVEVPTITSSAPTTSGGGGTDAPTPGDLPATPTTDQPTSSTLAPTLAINLACLGENQTRDEYMFEVLANVTTNSSQLTDPATAPGQAFVWMTMFDQLRPNVCTYPTLAQRYGLATLFFATAGRGWVNNTDWLGAMPECDWYGVVCLSNVNGTQRVTNLTLSTNNMVGSLPDEISTLYKMTQMEYFNNSLTGTLPAVGIANLTDLCVLDVEQNGLVGDPFAPAEGQPSTGLLSLPLMKNLFLSSNEFEATIPEAINQLSRLEDLWFADNNFVGSIPTTIASLTNLSTLIAYSNRLDGSVPDQFGQLSELMFLQMHSNNLLGTLPDSFFGLTKLAVLQIDTNFLSGTLPDAIGAMTDLTDLRLDENFFVGTLPETLANLSDLRFLTMQMTFFDGTIPNVFGAAWQQLQQIDMSACLLSGPIPDTLFEAPNLENVFLQNNQLNGTLPATYSQPPNLTDFFIFGNQLTGPVPPPQDGQLTRLNEFLLQQNSITGTMPESICSLRADQDQGGALVDLFSDCAGEAPEIECLFPTCCNRCFENTAGVAASIMASTSSFSSALYYPGHRQLLTLDQHDSTADKPAAARVLSRIGNYYDRAGTATTS